MSVETVDIAETQPDQPAFAALVDSLPDPVMVVSARDAEDASDRRLVFANLAARTGQRTGHADLDRFLAQSMT